MPRGFCFAIAAALALASPRMSHITEIALENYRSFRQARCRLSPFTLIVGANNSGKTNLLKAVREASELTAGSVSRDDLRVGQRGAQPRDRETYGIDVRDKARLSGKARRARL